MLRVATDIGGTFTDLVFVTPGRYVGAAEVEESTRAK